jgi:NTP pyrophosphatase (non-canonical NTP hydrolase)
MENQTHARFLAANQELRDFLRRVASLANGTGKATEEDLEKISLRLMNLGPEVGDASRSETLDTTLLSEVAEYVKNLKALQSALEKVRNVMPAHRAQLKAR